MPKETEVAQKILSIRGNDHANINLIGNISYTTLTDLCTSYEYPPPTPDCIAWHAAQPLPKMMGVMHESRTNECKMYESPTRTFFCKLLKPGATINEVTHEMITKPSFQRVVQVTPGKGRRKGEKKYTNRHIDILLDCAEDDLPCGKMMWYTVSLACNSIDPEFLKNGESFKFRFHKMAFATKPTGQAKILIQIRRVKSIKRKIDAGEVTGMVGRNEPDSDEDEVWLTWTSVARGARWLWPTFLWATLNKSGNYS